AERAQAVEADVEADVGDAAIGRPQQEHRALDAPALQVAVRRLAERRAKRSDEMRLRHVSDPREARDVERLRERAVHRIPRAQHPAIPFLDRSAHPVSFIPWINDDWKRIRDKWESSHVVRAVLAGLGFVFLVIAVAL